MGCGATRRGIHDAHLLFTGRICPPHHPAPAARWLSEGCAPQAPAKYLQSAASPLGTLARRKVRGRQRERADTQLHETTRPPDPTQCTNGANVCGDLQSYGEGRRRLTRNMRTPTHLLSAQIIEARGHGVRGRAHTELADASECWGRAAERREKRDARLRSLTSLVVVI